MTSPYDLRWQCNLDIYIVSLVIMLYNFCMVYRLDSLFSESGANDRINSLEYLNDEGNCVANVFIERFCSFFEAGVSAISLVVTFVGLLQR